MQSDLASNSVSEVLKGEPNWAILIAKYSVRLRHLGLLLAMMIFALAWVCREPPVYRLGIDELFSPNDPDLLAFQLSKHVFGNDDLVLAAYPDPQILQTERLDACAAWAQSLRKIAGVQTVICLADPGNRLVLTADAPWAQAARELVSGFAWAPNNNAAVAICQLSPADPAGAARRATITALREHTRAMAPQGILAGEPVMLVDGIDFVEQDGRRLSAVAAGLMLGVLAVCFRSLRWLVLPLVIIVWTAVVSHSLLEAMGVELSMVGSMIGSMIMVIVVGATTHLPIRFRQARQLGLDRPSSLQVVLTQVGAPLLWSMITDACGFLSLWVVDVAPVRDFGTSLATASLMVLPATYLLTPGLVLLASWGGDCGEPPGEQALTRRLRQTVHMTTGWRRLGWLPLLALAVGGIWGLCICRVETNFLTNFRAETEIAQSYNYLEQNFGGVGVWFAVIPLPKPKEPGWMAQLETLSESLNRLVATDKQATSLTKALCLPDLLRVVKASPLGGPLAWLAPQQQIALLQQQQPGLLKGMLQTDSQSGVTYTRLMLRASEMAPADVRSQTVMEVRRRVEQVFPEAKVTGLHVLLGRLVESLLRGQTLSALVALGLVGGALVLATGSLKLSALGLVPNTLPILVVGGSLGWLGIPLNMGAAMISAVSLGMTVDTSLHYLAAYQRQRKAGANALAALLELQSSVGVAVCFSTLALCLGFAALTSSQFVPTVYFGALAGLALAGGLIGNLVLLPWLLQMFDA